MSCNQNYLLHANVSALDFPLRGRIEIESFTRPVLLVLFYFRTIVGVAFTARNSFRFHFDVVAERETGFQSSCEH